ncbi:VOC family protein [Desulfovibrio intestinalis]|uniref:Catechol 2,3-dioxygenase-like lactoylglutathione lyase family enzyme n=1 Tax=Desulfovibrio intestinalis TaxID=58621 RepID=A0A7W8C291_9BACT|nr:VOC family protein [Desulfovibrio intestinalis]MBB5143533.1 catechol 2,3-dioxygenase-like lactoylglutathione lyase family enzyme [Desulfovibrio intestinalis]
MQPNLPQGIKVLFVSGFGPVVNRQQESEHLYRDMFGLPLEHTEGYEGYWHTQAVEGVKHFALWPLDKAALSCFGTAQWPEEVPVPQAWLELDVEDIESATQVLEQNGYTMLVRLKQEPWGQTVTRFLSPEGLLVAVALTPFLRNGE